MEEPSKELDARADDENPSREVKPGEARAPINDEPWVRLVEKRLSEEESVRIVGVNYQRPVAEPEELPKDDCGENV